jgi:hypothetical protein
LKSQHIQTLILEVADVAMFFFALHAKSLNSYGNVE